MIRSLVLAVVGMLLVASGGCSSAGIAIKESFGYAKREQLVDKVESARDAQVAAKEQFESALDEFIAVTNPKDGKTRSLEAQYGKLKSQYSRCEDRAEAVRTRIRETDRVANALFSEWERELDQYESRELRRASERQLSDTKSRYGQLIGAMKAAEGKMEPVLAAFKDQTLFLKHNLNAQAIASLQGSVAEIETDVANLIREMEESIAEANRFISDMQTNTGG